jgi:TatA/E family protein of Tat protein translocase
MGPLGWQETVFIFVLALLIFGPKKLPELGKTIGKALTEFRRASSELKTTWDREMINLERESESIKEVTGGYQSEINDYASSYSYEDSYNQPSSYDSTATNPSTVGASATEGAEPTADTASDISVAAAEAAGENEGMASEVAVAEPLASSPVPDSAGKADGSLNSEPQAPAG